MRLANVNITRNRRWSQNNELVLRLELDLAFKWCSLYTERHWYVCRPYTWIRVYAHQRHARRRQFVIIPISPINHDLHISARITLVHGPPIDNGCGTAGHFAQFYCFHSSDTWEAMGGRVAAYWLLIGRKTSQWDVVSLMPMTMLMCVTTAYCMYVLYTLVNSI